MYVRAIACVHVCVCVCVCVGGGGGGGGGGLQINKMSSYTQM